MTFEQALELIESKADLSISESEQFLAELLDNDKIGNDQVASALTSLTKKTVKTDEILGFLAAMRARMISVPSVEGAIDTCGTGGDKSNTFNISTASAIVLAAGGVKVAKHGNRSASSKCGSTDVLEALNIPIDNTPAIAMQKLGTDNFVFLFAQHYHPNLKKLAIVRKQLGFPTVFNLLGPLLNPASVNRQVIGTYSLENAKTIADVVSKLNYEHAIVLVSDDGLDEASLSSATNIIDIHGSDLVEYKIKPEDFDIKPAERIELMGGDPLVNADIIRAVFEPRQELTAAQRIVVLNAAVGFYAAGLSEDIADGVKIAIDTIQSGKAKQKLNDISIKNV